MITTYKEAAGKDAFSLRLVWYTVKRRLIKEFPAYDSLPTGYTASPLFDPSFGRMVECCL
jgi:hypothetical protein